ncbi:uncharacterized protein LOC119075627 [Bradysia coprophila]|uniref:uncharacterized protein LOC119075627 n=1 Tax=Bradysia coprophila TaxID=38358 RepID=UPI00187DAC1F|nr:uncharacterized protein LOC119075627 [Bradysia coprophila]
MEKSSTINYNENLTPSAPTLNGSNLNSPEDTGADPRFIDNGFNNDFGQKSNFEPPPQQSTNSIPSFMPHLPDSDDSYCGRLFKNRRQIRSIAGGLLLMLGSGLHIGWGIWRSSYYGRWILTANDSIVIFMIMAWSLGAFLGGFAGSIITPMLKKQSIYLLSAAIFIVGNVLIIIWDDEGGAIGAGRVLTGAAHGIGYVTLITHAGENAAQNMRGTILSIINCMLYTGIFVSVIITGTVQYNSIGVPDTISDDRIVVIVSIPLAILSIAASMMTIESVPFLLHRNCHDNAKFNLQNLRGSSHETLELTREMEELHLMIIQDKRDSWNIFTDGNVKPLVLTILMRIMVAMTNNYLINVITILFTFRMFNLHQYRLVPLVVVAPRLAMSIVQIFYADVLKRKIQIIVSSVFAGIVLIIIGIILNAVQSWAATVTISVLWLIFQLACSMGMDQMQDVYLSEAFSTAKKQWSLPFVAGIDHMFHIFMIGMFFAGIDSLAHLYAIIFITGIVVIILGVVLVLALPETQNMSLKQAKDSFINYTINISSPFA